MASLVNSDDTVPSSPSAAVFSDEPQRTSSPPSSPPGFPWEDTKSSSHIAKVVKSPERTAFSVLGKRKALESIDDNVRPKKKASAHATRQPDQPLTQMQISLGQEVQKKCKTCGMEYVQSSAEDRRLHDKYHKQNTEGYDVGKDFVKQARPIAVFNGRRTGDNIYQITCLDKPAWKKRGQAALEVVQRELGAVEIPETTIWNLSQCSRHKGPNYHAYLYVRERKCIGFLLTQRIKRAYTVVEPADSDIPCEERQQIAQTNGSSARDALKARQEAEAKRRDEVSQRPIVLSRDKTSAVLGISRIWTSATHRRQNIAKRLLDNAFKTHDVGEAERARTDIDSEAHSRTQDGDYEEEQDDFDNFCSTVPELESYNDVAFSQPTEAGTRLARKWFGKMFGWKVYVD